MIFGQSLSLPAAQLHTALADDRLHAVGHAIDELRRVGGLCGGTKFSNVRFHGDDERAAKLYENANALRPEDIADTVYWIASCPPHMNVNTISLMPVSQSFAGLSVSKKP